MSTIKCTTIQNLSGVEVYTAKAWVNFNGTGTVAIRAAGNVSSITDNGVGDYTVNFINAMPDANYSLNGTARRSVSENGAGTGVALSGISAQSTSSVRIYSFAWNTIAYVVADSDHVHVSIFR